MSGFNQAAFRDIDEAERQTIAYFEGLTVTRSWPTPVVDQLTTWVSAIASTQRSTFGAVPFVQLYNYATDSGGGVDAFWSQIVNEFDTEINRITNNDPSSLAGVNAVAATLGAGQVTSQAEAGASGLTGAINVVTETIEEKAADQRKRNEQFEKWAPFALPALGLAALFVTIKAIK